LTGIAFSDRFPPIGTYLFVGIIRVTRVVRVLYSTWTGQHPPTLEYGRAM
jgi:hypothetical protein